MSEDKILLEVPITGTVKQVEPCILGDDDDPIRLIDVKLGNVSWRLIELDLDNEIMKIEVISSPTTGYDTGQKDKEDKPIWTDRPTTPEERAELIENARNHSLERMSKQALYALSKSPKLKNPFKNLERE